MLKIPYIIIDQGNPTKFLISDWPYTLYRLFLPPLCRTASFKNISYPVLIQRWRKTTVIGLQLHSQKKAPDFQDEPWKEALWFLLQKRVRQETEQTKFERAFVIMLFLVLSFCAKNWSLPSLPLLTTVWALELVWISFTFQYEVQ